MLHNIYKKRRYCLVMADVAQKRNLNSGLKPSDNFQKSVSLGKKAGGENAVKKGIVEKKISEQEAKQIKYHTAEKTSISEFIKKSISQEFIPTKKSGYALGVIFLLVLVIGLLQFPFSSFLSGKGEFAIKIGIPYPFFVFDLLEPEQSPLVWKGFLIDLLIYVVIAYFADVLINLAVRFIKKTGKEEREKRPKVFNPPKSSLAEKATHKIAQGTSVKKEIYKPKSKSIEVFDLTKTKKANAL